MGGQEEGCTQSGKESLNIRVWPHGDPCPSLFQRRDRARPCANGGGFHSQPQKAEAISTCDT
jgi:hypothetical protein